MAEKSLLTTLCYIEKDGSYLMLHRVKKEHDVNKDKWIGVGGHFEKDESPEECLLREVREETGLELTSYHFRGIVTFMAEGWPTEYMCLYTADGFTGELTPCVEGNLEWVDKKDICHLNLWEGDFIFFQLLEDRESFFSLKLQYRGDTLVGCRLDGRDMELLDVRSPDGAVTGKVRERSLVHRDGDLHGTAHVWIVRKRKGQQKKSGAGRLNSDEVAFDVLLQKRCMCKDSYPGCYDISSAGHVPAGCDFQESAVRELKEELGLPVEAEDLQLAFYHVGYAEDIFYGKMFKNHEFSAVYVLEKPLEISSFKLQEEEVESVVWIDYDQCLEQMKNGELHHCIFLDEFEELGRFVRGIQ